MYILMWQQIFIYLSISYLGIYTGLCNLDKHFESAEVPFLFILYHETVDLLANEIN